MGRPSPILKFSKPFITKSAFAVIYLHILIIIIIHTEGDWKDSCVSSETVELKSLRGTHYACPLLIKTYLPQIMPAQEPCEWLLGLSLLSPPAYHNLTHFRLVSVYTKWAVHVALPKQASLVPLQWYQWCEHAVRWLSSLPVTKDIVSLAP